MILPAWRQKQIYWLPRYFIVLKGRLVINPTVAIVHGLRLLTLPWNGCMKTESGIILTLSLSFNNDGPLGTFFRYICDNGTYIARYDDLVDGYEKEIDVSRVDVSMNGIELQDREFVAAIREGRESRSSISQVIDCYRVLDQIEKTLGD